MSMVADRTGLIALGVAGAGSGRGVRPPEEFCLPAGYRQQAAALTHDDAVMVDERGSVVVYWNEERIRASARYQRHVYAWAARLVGERGFRSVLDVGCGPCVKLTELVVPVCADVEGIDQASAIAAAKKLGTRAALREIDLENCERTAAWRTFDLIVCADVVEHLLDPDPMLRLLRRLGHERTMILISTPDRARLRGRGCMASEKPEHVREWAEAEFVTFLRSRGFAIERVKRLPGDDAPVRRGLMREMAFRAGLAGTSEHRCCTVLCRAGRV
jgi:SAM-dependent methyltransferase